MRLSSVSSLSVAILLLAGNSVYADQSIDTLRHLNQSQFDTLGEDLSAALSYKPVIPAEPLGLLGFDISAEYAITKISDKNLFRLASNNWSNLLDENVGDYIGVARLHAHKGLPFGLDVGLSLGSVTNSNANVWGAEFRYSLLEGSTLTPAVAVRAAYSDMGGVDVMDLTTQSLDVSISKGFLMLTPYAGIGHVWAQADPSDPLNPNLASSDISQVKIFGGLNFSLGLFNSAIEYDNTGGNSSASVKLGVRF
jgi:hypothetical protein